MNNKKEFLQVATIGLLALNLLNTNKVEAPITSERVDFASSLQAEVEQVNFEYSSFPKADSAMNQQDIWDMKHDSEYFRYVPLKAFKAEYNGTEYYYLHDNEGAFYIEFNELVDGGNYIAEVGKYSDKIYELEISEFKFSEEYEQSYRDYRIVDSELAENMVKDMLIDI